MRLSDATWPELDGRAPLVVVPLGSVEQHGRHLPVATDTVSDNPQKNEKKIHKAVEKMFEKYPGAGNTS